MDYYKTSFWTKFCEACFLINSKVSTVFSSYTIFFTIHDSVVSAPQILTKTYNNIIIMFRLKTNVVFSFILLRLAGKMV